MSRAALLLAAIVATLSACAAPIVIGEGAKVREQPRAQYSRYINWAPGDGEVVDLNPPRFRWPYDPSWLGPKPVDAAHRFTFQIASEATFAKPVLNVTCDFNFYNTIGALPSPGPWYWRVGYDIGSPAAKWSDVRQFTIAPDAQVWDRSKLAEPTFAAASHPRILFTAESLPKLRQLAQTEPSSQAALAWLVRQADAVLQKPWWGNFPKTDREQEPAQEFYTIAGDLATVAFVWKLTGDAKYAGVVERAVTWASYPPGGRASPEALGGDGNEDASQGNEYLALLFDWLYQDLDDAQRQVMIGSLNWRVEHLLKTFAWHSRGAGGAMLRLTFRNSKLQGEAGQLGDQRFFPAPSDDWQSFNWRVRVPQGATDVTVEPFNYYAAGETHWDTLHVRGSETGPDLLRNGDFSQAAGDRPANWSASVYGTTAKVGYDRTGSGSINIRCADSTERGAFSQTVELQGARELVVEGSCRTVGLLAAGVRPTSLAGMNASHQYEMGMDTAVCGLVLYEHSAVGRRWFEIALNYLIGINCGFGFDQGWNEGAGYGTSKAKWLINATCYYDSALPDADLGRNPFYRDIGDWFCRIIPVGMDHHAWGNQRNASRGNHLSHMRKLAYLTGEGRFLYNWQQYGGETFSNWRAWIEVALPYFYQEPKPAPETTNVRLFPISGWCMAATGPPSDRRTYETGAGFIFQCRPRGGYSHSFNSDGSVQLHAYGQMLNHGGSSSGNGDAIAYHSMSHNLILVDGLGQAQPSSGMLHPSYGRIVGFEQGDDYVYVAGDVTNAYPHEPGNFSRWSLPLDAVYTQRALPYLQRVIRHVLFVKGKYFVLCDDLQASQPATWTWLWHILPDEPLRWDAGSSTLDYTVNKLPVKLLLATSGAVTFEDRRGEQEMVNPLTGEDYRKLRKDGPLPAHNLWVSNADQAANWRYITVVYPQPPGGTIPAIRKVDDSAVKVGDDVIRFGDGDATIRVDLAAFRGR